MANTKITRKVALDAIITFARENGYDNKEILDVVDNMLSKLGSSKKSNTETKAHYQNARILQDNLYLFQEGAQAFTAREFANSAKNFPVDNTGRPSIHKATAVLVQGVNDGILERVISEKKSNPAKYALKISE